jgi:hypothetical protein
MNNATPHNNEKKPKNLNFVINPFARTQKICIICNIIFFFSFMKPVHIAKYLKCLKIKKLFVALKKFIFKNQK